MIRIDLGKDELQQDSKLRTSKRIQYLIRSKGKSTLIKATSNATNLIVLISGLLLASAPHVFFLEYSRIVKNQHGQKKKELQDRIQVADAEIARLTPFKRELESYEGQKKMVEARLGAVRQLLAQRATPVFVLDSIAQSLPNRVWLTGIEFSLEGTIQLAGAALSNDDISDYMDRLSESVHLSDVTLIDVAATRDNRTDLKTFSISARPKSQT